MTRVRIPSVAVSMVLLTLVIARPCAHADEPTEPQLGSTRIEFSGLPFFAMRQIEGPERDDLVATDLGVVTALRADVTLWNWLSAGIMLGFDVGRTTGGTFSRPDMDGKTTETASTGGAYWEHWTTLILRADWEPMFFEVGWAPLILRSDAGRRDLPNTKDETDGIFVGSRSVAYLLAVGAQIPMGEELWLTGRLQFRIRYMVSRGGEALADDEEFGQMHLWPQIGIRYGIF